MRWVGGLNGVGGGRQSGATAARKKEMGSISPHPVPNFSYPLEYYYVICDITRRKLLGSWGQARRRRRQIRYRPDELTHQSNNCASLILYGFRIDHPFENFNCCAVEERRLGAVMINGTVHDGWPRTGSQDSFRFGR